jgi:hypothetical protein
LIRRFSALPAYGTPRVAGTVRVSRPAWWRTVGIAGWIGLVALAAGPRPGLAQEPWLGWHGPPAEGIYGMRFGMDRATVEAKAEAAGLTVRRSRHGTLRFDGRLEGYSAELVAEFVDDALGGLGGRLRRIQVRWTDFPVMAEQAVGLFRDLDADLRARHGAPLVVRNSSPNQLSTGMGIYRRVYRDVELQAVLELKAPRPDRYDLTLGLEYPQLSPELSGR